MKKEKQTIVAIVLPILLICLCAYSGYNYINIYLKNDESMDDTQNNDNDGDIHKSKSSIYFYQNGNELLYLNPKELERKDEYDIKYNYLSKYICKNDTCEVLISSGQAGAGKINYNFKSVGVFIREDMEEFYFFDFKIGNIIQKYSAHPYVACNNLEGSGTLLYQKDNKVAIIDKNGQISSYYDDIMGGKFGTYDLNFSNKYGISQYENDGKQGIISLITGAEITGAIYDEVLIYHDNIIVKKDDLDYVIDENGNIKSKGYKNILDATDKVIIIEDNGLIDIIDYNGISKINEKIDSGGLTQVYRRPCGGPSPATSIMQIEVNNDNIEIFIQDNDGIFNYIYNQENETLSIDTKIN